MNVSSDVDPDLEWRAEHSDDWRFAPDPRDFAETDPQIALAALAASGEAHTVAVAELEALTVRTRMLIADQYHAISMVLTDAAACPDPWVGADPTLDPAWRDPQDRSISAVRAERSEIAVRSAALDLSIRLGLSEQMIRNRAAYADTLRDRCPRLWAAFRAGGVSEQNAVTAAQQAATLPDRSPDSWARFDEMLATAAQTLTPGKFRLRARVVRERVHPEHIDERHQRAADDRTTWLTNDPDGMATYTIYGRAADLHSVDRRIDAHARHLRAQSGEERTLAQLRADVAVELLINGETALTAGTGPRGRASVAVTVPVLTLLGQSDEPATLHGYGPIDTDTARRFAGEASSWVRILTHPITGTVLDVDRTTYRVPKALRRWLGVRQPVCIAPGCTRLAPECDIDHRLDWQYGGTTSDANNDPLCRPHHVIKTKSRMRLYRDEKTGAKWWMTPTGLEVAVEPAPF
ncbi:DUF222 domain-containing protein [Microbacterium sp. ZW T2_14]|uniref:HNH endonuclease signature motif containing protein n=1 Tax=Microbacterium sp. ZW T2_14 TaxID=3378079 RepID=UPI003851AF5F